MQRVSNYYKISTLILERFNIYRDNKIYYLLTMNFKGMLANH